MGRDWKESNNYTLTSKEVEKLLLDDFGDKLHPVDNAKMARQRYNQSRRHDKQTEALSNADDQSTDILNDPGI